MRRRCRDSKPNESILDKLRGAISPETNDSKKSNIQIKIGSNMQDIKIFKEYLHIKPTSPMRSLTCFQNTISSQFALTQAVDRQPAATQSPFKSTSSYSNVDNHEKIQEIGSDSNTSPKSIRQFPIYGRNALYPSISKWGAYRLIRRYRRTIYNHIQGI